MLKILLSVQLAKALMVAELQRSWYVAGRKMRMRSKGQRKPPAAHSVETEVEVLSGTE